jgi:hypothetical protein
MMEASPADIPNRMKKYGVRLGPLAGPVGVDPSGAVLDTG